MNGLWNLLLILVILLVALGLVIGASELLNPEMGHAEAVRLEMRTELERQDKQNHLDRERQEIEARARAQETRRQILEEAAGPLTLVTAGCLIMLTLAACYRLAAGGGNNRNGGGGAPPTHHQPPQGPTAHAARTGGTQVSYAADLPHWQPPDGRPYRAQQARRINGHTRQ